MNAIDLTQVDLNLLVLFEAVFEEKHVGGAARRLHVSSSAVSHGLGRLRALFEDPLFLRVPKGVVPTVRAAELAGPIGEILAGVRQVMGTVAPFDPASSSRRFSIGGPDATLAVLLPHLIPLLERDAPRIDLGTRQLLPTAGLGDLESRALDLLILPVDEVPVRFVAKVVYEDEFVIAGRKKHPFFRSPTLRAYCELRHVLVSTTGDSGHLDQELAKKKASRRVALSVPNFMLALSVLAETDFVAAVPRSLLAMHAPTFGLASVDAPLPLRRWQLRAIATSAALADPGVAWLFGVVERAAQVTIAPRRRTAR